MNSTFLFILVVSSYLEVIQGGHNIAFSKKMKICLRVAVSVSHLRVAVSTSHLRVAGRSRATRTSAGCSSSTGGEVRPGRGSCIFFK